MITVAQAEDIIFKHTLDLPDQVIALEKANGRLLREDLKADRDFPPFHRVTMDGIAINKAQNPDQTHFKVAGVVAAGQQPTPLSPKDHCLEVMTGAVLPADADTIIPYEHIKKTDEGYQLLQQATLGQNIHKKATDRAQGSIIVPRDTVISAAEAGVAATVGKASILVKSLPKVAIISTGDELVAIDQSPLPHQIRSSNASTMAHACQRWGIMADLFHIVDDLQGTINELQNLLQEYQILLLSGGVSKGKFDHVPKALSHLQVSQSFHRISQRPGKPFWFGYHQNGCKVFAFPGNPVSSFMCFNRYFTPWLDRELGVKKAELFAELAQEIAFTPDLTYFAQVRLQQENQKLMAWPVEGHGSGDLANLVDADAFIELPRGQDSFAKGTVCRVYPYRD